MINKKNGKNRCDVRQGVLAMEYLIGHVTKSTKYVSMDTSKESTTSPKEPKGNASTVIPNLHVEKPRNVIAIDLHVSTEETRIVNANQMTELVVL